MTQFIPFGNRFHLREIVRATFGDKSVDRSQPLANADPHVSSHSVEILLLDRIYTTEKSLIANLFFIKNMFIHFYMYRIGNVIIIVICGILFQWFSIHFHGCYNWHRYVYSCMTCWRLSMTMNSWSWHLEIIKNLSNNYVIFFC